jgi:hypothetical protein
MPILLYLIGLHFCIFHVPHLPPCLEAAAHEVKNPRFGVEPKAPLQFCNCEQNPPAPDAQPAHEHTRPTRSILRGILSFLRESAPVSAEKDRFVLDGTVFCLTLWALF